ncbi:sterol 4-alpha-methyl-oxidase 2-2, partial [Striga asiatica]
MTADSTAPSYWLNWKFLVCATWVLIATVFSALLIWRHEGSRKQSSGESQHEAAGCLYEDEVWSTCSKSVHPIWLLAYRIIAFCALLALLLVDIVTLGAIQWTFTLVTIYFGVGSFLSIRGCLHYYREGKVKMDCQTCTESKNGSYVPPSLVESAVGPSQSEGSSHCGEPNIRTFASSLGYALQIIFQMCAGSVVLTDSVFWVVLYPYIAARRLNFLIVSKHSLNAVFLLGDAILNHLSLKTLFRLLLDLEFEINGINKFLQRFPFFRIAYFVLWTCIYVIFQWIVALSFSGLVFSICSIVVLGCWIAASSMFWDLLSHLEVEEMFHSDMTDGLCSNLKYIRKQAET